MSIRARRVPLKLIVEYALLTSPIFLYVGIESIHHSHAWYLVSSPEWSIATIFVLIQTYRLYTEEMRTEVGRQFGHVLVLMLVVCATGATVNIFMSMQDPHDPSMTILLVRFGLLSVATVIFIYVAGAALYAAEGERQ